MWLSPGAAEMVRAGLTQGKSIFSQLWGRTSLRSPGPLWPLELPWLVAE